MTSGKVGSNPPGQFICEQCGECFSRVVYPSYEKKHGLPRFCSVKCRNIANAQVKELESIPCPICNNPFKPYQNDGRRQKYCSIRCARKAVAVTDREQREKINQAIRESYATEGPDGIVERFGVSKQYVQDLAYKLGITLDDKVFYERVHEAAREYMLNHNPMTNPETVARVQEYWDSHPKKRQERNDRLIQAQAKVQRQNPSSLERQLCHILNEFDIEYEKQAVIKPKFIVDVRIGNLIIQADGDYWHGHPRFEPLSERQKKQRKRDKAQDKYLSACGYTVVRIWESDMSRSIVQSILEYHSLIKSR